MQINRVAFFSNQNVFKNNQNPETENSKKQLWLVCKTTCTSGVRLEEVTSMSSLSMRIGWFHHHCPTLVIFSRATKLTFYALREVMTACWVSPKCQLLSLTVLSLSKMLKLGQAKTFQEYSSTVLQTLIPSFLATADRIDIVWDCYHDDSLKSSVRMKR